MGKTAPNPNPNTYAKKRGNTVEVFLATQYAINGWTIWTMHWGRSSKAQTIRSARTEHPLRSEARPHLPPKTGPNRLAYYQQALEIWG